MGSPPTEARGDEAPRRHLGLDLHSGPAGLGLGVVGRPLTSLWLGAGVDYNFLRPGFYAQAGVAPLGTTLRPSLTLEAGRMFPGSASRGVELLTGQKLSAGAATLLRRMEGTRYAASLGLEMGRGAVQAFARAGVLYVDYAFPEYGAALRALNPGSSTRYDAAALHARVLAPQVSYGVVWYVW